MKEICLICMALFGAVISNQGYADTVDCQKIKKQAKRLECFDAQAKQKEEEAKQKEEEAKQKEEEAKQKAVEDSAHAKDLFSKAKSITHLNIGTCHIQTSTQLIKVHTQVLLHGVSAMKDFDFSAVRACTEGVKKSLNESFAELKTALSGNKEETTALADWYAAANAAIDSTPPEGVEGSSNRSIDFYDMRVKSKLDEMDKKANYLSGLLM